MRSLTTLLCIAVLTTPAYADLRGDLREAKKTVRRLNREEPVGWEETLDDLLAGIASRVVAEVRGATVAVGLDPAPARTVSRAVERAEDRLARSVESDVPRKRLRFLKKALADARRAFRGMRKRSPDLEEALASSVATIGDARIDESSGLVFWHGAFWTMNDSGAPVLYRSETPDFADARAYPVPDATLVDWEDLAVFEGDLIVADIGDNNRVRDDLVLYRVAFDGDELSLVAAYDVAYPDGAHDAEALASVDGTLHVITKDRGDGTRVYRFDALDADGTNVAVPVVTLDLGGDQATAAEYDGESGRLILLSYLGVRFYDPADWVAGPIERVPFFGLQAEALTCAGDLLVITNEQRQVFAAIRP